MEIKDFDKIWCLSACDIKRLEHCDNEFNRLGWNVEYYHNPKNPLTYLANKDSFKTGHYNKIYEKNNEVYNNVLACFVGHYVIIKTSYLLGYNKILVCEDDLSIDPSVDMDHILKLAPDDSNCMNFFWSTNTWRGLKPEYNGEDDFWVESDGYGVRCTMLYMLDRKGMESYLSYYQINKPEPADFFYKRIYDMGCKVYVNNYNIIYDNNLKSLIRYDKKRF